MHKFFCDFLKQKCREINLYMDTDSFIFEVIGENFNDIMLDNKEYFDLSNFSKDSVISQYDLDREAAKISALSYNNLDEYEYQTGEDLGIKPSTFKKAKFEYSPLGKICNKGLSEDDKKEGLLKKTKKYWR